MGLPTYDVPYSYQALSGGVPGAGRVAALGINEDIDTATQPEDVWSGSVLGVLNGIDHKLIPRPSTAVSMELVSTSADDTAAGTGARSVVIGYLDTDYVAQLVVLPTNGLTPVALPSAARRINTFICADSVGTYGGTNIGTLSIRAAGGLGATYAHMPAGVGIHQSSLYTTPLGVSYDVLGLLFSITRVDTSDRWATFSNCVQGPGGRLVKGFQIGISSSAPYRHESAGLPINVLPPRTDIWIRCEVVSGNSTAVTGAHFGISRSKNLAG